MTAKGAISVAVLAAWVAMVFLPVLKIIRDMRRDKKRIEHLRRRAEFRVIAGDKKAKP